MNESQVDWQYIRTLYTHYTLRKKFKMHKRYVKQLWEYLDSQEIVLRKIAILQLVLGFGICQKARKFIQSKQNRWKHTQCDNIILGSTPLLEYLENKNGIFDQKFVMPKSRKNKEGILMWYCSSIRASKVVRGQYIEEYDTGKDIIARDLANIPDPSASLVWISLNDFPFQESLYPKNYTIKDIARSFNTLGRLSPDTRDKKNLNKFQDFFKKNKRVKIKIVKEQDQLLSSQGGQAPSLEEFETPEPKENIFKIDKNKKKKMEKEKSKRFSIKSPTSIDYSQASLAKKRSSFISPFEKTAKRGSNLDNRKWKTAELNSESPKKSGFFSKINPRRRTKKKYRGESKHRDNDDDDYDDNKKTNGTPDSYEIQMIRSIFNLNSVKKYKKNKNKVFSISIADYQTQNNLSLSSNQLKGARNHDENGNKKRSKSSKMQFKINKKNGFLQSPKLKLSSIHHLQAQNRSVDIDFAYNQLLEQCRKKSKKIGFQEEKSPVLKGYMKTYSEIKDRYKYYKRLKGKFNSFQVL